MRRRGRVDANQNEIVDALRQGGCSVASLANVGGGVPDLLIGYRGKTWLAEVKVKDGRYTQDQIKWRMLWEGNPPLRFVAVDDVIRFLRALK